MGFVEGCWVFVNEWVLLMVVGFAVVGRFVVVDGG